MEITSGASGFGKTHLLYYLTAVAVLPTWKDRRRTGRSGAVAVLDTDGRFDVVRLAEVMRTQLHETITEAIGDALNARSIDQAVINALHHVHIFRPQSLASLIATAEALPAYLMNIQNHTSSERSLDLLLLDSAGAFFWQEKMVEEALRFDSEANATSHPHSIDNQYSQLANHLRTIQRHFDCPIVTTNWGISPAPNQAKGVPTSFRPFLPPVWQAFLSLKLVIERDAVTKFAASMTVDQALRDAPTRQAAVDEGKFSVWVERFGDDEWSQVVRDRARGPHDNVKFVFRITSDGLIMG